MMLLAPQPRQLTLHAGRFTPSAASLIQLNADAPHALIFIARQLQAALRSFANVEWEIVAGKHVPADQIGVSLSVTPGAIPHPQGYALTITPERIDVVAAEPVGAFYAVQTLRQILQQHGRSLPTLRCSDQPEFPHRGVMLDISRDRVPTMHTLYGLVDMLASWKINQLQLYTEHTFAYRAHPTVWADASPLTGEEILALDAYCRERFIELVPNQNTFGHMHRWLEHDAYRHLAEAPDGSITPWNGLRFEGPYSLSPVVPGSLDLVRDMLDELLPHFRSRQVNVGCDETFDLGQGLSQKLVEEQGVGRVYLDFLLKIHREVKSRGHTMQFWGDIIMEHPELTPELPRDAIALEWGYEADHPFAEHGALFADSGIPFYVCPGTSSWRTLAGRTDNAIGNLRNAAANGLKHGAVGYLITDWGDNGHWQPLPASYLGFLYGAALGWGYDANVDLDIPAALDAFIFADKAGIMGRLVFDLGNIYQTPGLLMPNSSVLFNALQASPEQIRDYSRQLSDPAAFPARTRETLTQIDAIMAPLPQTDMQIEDATLVVREFTWVADMLRHACHRILWALGENNGRADANWLAKDTGRLISEFGAIWRERSRPGGFRESVARMAEMGWAYESTR